MRSPYFMLPVLMAFAGAYYLYAKGQVAFAPIESSLPPPKPQSLTKPLPLLKKPEFKPRLDLGSKPSETSKLSKFLFFWNTRLTIDGVTYKFLEKVGEGGNGKVKKAINVHTQEECAIKITTNLYSVRDNLNAIGDLKDYGSRVNDDGDQKEYYVLPFVDGVNFSTLLHDVQATNSRKMVLFKDQIKYAEAFLKTFEEYHSVGYIVSDVKVTNYMWNHTKQAMIRIDKDATQKENPNVEFPVTRGHMAPEANKKYKNYTVKSEIFSAGVVLMYIFSPYSSQYVRDLKAGKDVPDLKAGEFDKHIKTYHDHEPETALEKSIWNLCKKMVDTNPDKRPSIADALTELQNIKCTQAQAIEDRHKADLDLDSKIDRLKNDFSRIDSVYDLVLVYNRLQQEKRICYSDVSHMYIWNSESNLKALKRKFLELARDKAQNIAGAEQQITLENFQQALKDINKEAVDNHYGDDLDGLLNHRRDVWLNKNFFEETRQTTTCRNFIQATVNNDSNAAKDLMNSIMPTRRFCF